MTDLDRLIDYADRHGYKVKTRPARFGELHPTRDLLVTGIKDGVVYAIRRPRTHDQIWGPSR